MDEAVRQAIAGGLVCDITTIGRKSGRPSRIEIWYLVIDGQVYLTGTPGPRDWYANLLANPQFTFHVKEGISADLPARAEPILDASERRRIIGRVFRENAWFASQSYPIDPWVDGSPLVAVTFEDSPV